MKVSRLQTGEIVFQTKRRMSKMWWGRGEQREGKGVRRTVLWRWKHLKKTLREEKSRRMWPFINPAICAAE